MNVDHRHNPALSFQRRMDGSLDHADECHFKEDDKLAGRLEAEVRKWQLRRCVKS